MSTFFSTHCYTLGWQLGIDEAGEEFRRQCAEPDDESLPCVRTLHRLRCIEEKCGVWCDTGSTRLGHSRSRAFHDALSSDCDVWVTCDDDCEADLETVRSMLRAVEGSEPRICIVPFWGRSTVASGHNVPLNLSPCHTVRTLPTGEKLHKALTAGLGLTAVNRAALDDIAHKNRYSTYCDDDGVIRIALFIETLQGAHWLGEDLAFFSRVPPMVNIEALLTGRTVHAGRILDLELLRRAAELEAGHPL